MKDSWGFKIAFSDCRKALRDDGKPVKPKEVKALFKEKYESLFRSNVWKLADMGLDGLIQTSFRSEPEEEGRLPDIRQISLQFGVIGEIPESLPIPQDADHMTVERQWKSVAACTITEARLAIKYKRTLIAADARSMDRLQSIVDKAALVPGISEDHTIAEAFFASGGHLDVEAA